MTDRFVARSPSALADDVAALLAATPDSRPLRVLVDGVGSDSLADDVAERLRVLGRPPLRVRAEHFLRPAGERFEYGREDAQAFRERWLDAGALEREVLSAAVAGLYLPGLRDAQRDRSLQAVAQPAPPRSVLLVDGVLLLGRGLSADVTVHLTLSPAALRRRGIPEWQLAAFADYDREVRPGQACDVLVRAEDPERPAVAIRRSANRR